MDDLLREIEAYCRRAAIAETTFGRLSVNDGKFVGRLRAGGRCWPEKAAKVRDYMASNPPKVSV